MKEARLILPRDVPLVRALDVEEKLYANFGGFTQTTANGVWKSPSGEKLAESVTVIDVVYEQNTANDMILFTIAQTFLHDAHQIEVYLRYGNGTIQFIRENSSMDNGRPNEAYHPDFAGIIDAVDQLIDPAQTPGTRVAAFEYIHHTLDLGNKGRHIKKEHCLNDVGELDGKGPVASTAWSLWE